MDFVVNPFTLVSVPLFIIGISSTTYLLSARVKTLATRYLTSVLACFTLAMVTMFAQGIRFWGGAFWPLQDALAAIGMVGMIQFAYHFPERPRRRSLEQVVTEGLSVAIGAGGLVYSLIYMTRFLIIRQYGIGVSAAFLLVMPLTLAIALIVYIRRALQVHHTTNPRRQGEPILQWVWGALRHPAIPNARVLRDFAVALTFGLAQGVASALGLLGWLPWPWDIYATTLALLLMVAFIISSVLEHVGTPNGIEVKLVGLALTITLLMLSVVGLVLIVETTAQHVDEHYQQTEVIRQRLTAGKSGLATPELVYVMSWPLDGGVGNTVAPTIAYVRTDADTETASAAQLSQARPEPSAVPPSWRYTTEVAHRARAVGATGRPAILRYGENAPGTLHSYIGLQFVAGDLLYEVGFSLPETEASIRQVGTTMILLVLLSSVLATGGFVYVIRVHITRPLSHLLRGVAQANAGNYAVVVPVSYADDIGFLTRSFNQLTGSIATEIHERRAAEAQIRALNAGLEIQVASRTRELAALYEIAEVASQALSQEALLNESLAYVVAALNGEAGSVYLRSEGPHGGFAADAQEQQGMVSVAQAGLRHLPLLGTALPASHGLIRRASQRAPWLIRDVTTSPDVSDFGLQHRPAAMLCLPLSVEDALLGLLLVLAQPGHVFDLDEITLGTSMVDQIAIGLQATQFRERTTVLEERERIARDLHDSAIQALYGLVTLTGAASLQLDRDDHDAARHTLVRIGDTGRQAIREIRLFIHDLTPPALEDGGLIGAIHQRLATVEGRANIEARLLADDTLNLPIQTQRYLYQIVQEALNNTLKHAHATHVTVYLTTEGDTTVLEVLDDGVGFDADSVIDSPRSGLGLRSMRQRSAEIGAELHITSQPGHGTRVRISYTSRHRAD